MLDETERQTLKFPAVLQYLPYKVCTTVETEYVSGR